MDLKNIEVKVDSLCNVVVSHVVSPSEFYCQLVENCAELNELNQRLNVFYNTLSDNSLTLIPRGSNRGAIHVGQVCCARYRDDGAWYRARVTSIFNLQEVEVFFIDFGNVERVLVTELKVLSVEFSTVQGQALKCSLHDIDPVLDSWTVKSFKDFCEAVEEKEMFITIKCCKPNASYEVMLYTADGDINIARLLIQCGHGRKPSKAIPITSTPVVTKEPVLLIYSKIEIHDGCSLRVTVPWCMSLGDFYVQIQSQANEFTKLMQNLQVYYHRMNANDHLLQSPAVGAACIALYNVDSAWYRAEVIKASKDSVMVRFVDYGNAEVVNSRQLKNVHQDFLELPVQALRCTHKSIKPVSGDVWTKLPASTINKYFNRGFTCEFFLDDRSSDRYLVELKEGTKTLADEMVRNKHASYCDDAFVSDVRESPKPSVQIPESNVGNFVGKRITVSVSYVESISKFWCQLIADIDTLGELMDEIDACYLNQQADSSLTFEVGSVCIANYSADGGWYRARISSKESQDEFRVMFLDYGNAETVSRSEMRVIDPLFCGLSAQAIPCSLHDVTNCYDNDEEMVKYFKESVGVGEKELVADVKNVSQKCLSVVLYDNDECINRNIATKKIQVPDDAPLTKMAAARRLKLDDVFDARVMCVESSSRIFVVPLEDVAHLFELCDKLVELYGVDIPASVNQVTNGEHYVVFSDMYEGWYRAVVLERQNGDRINVMYVDFGDSEVVPLKNFKIMKPELKDYPPFSVCCSLGVNCSKQEIDTILPHESEVTVRITKETDPPTVDISVNGNDVKQQIVGGAPEFVESTPTTVSTLALDLGSEVNVEILHIDSPSNFYVTPSSEFERLSEFADNFQHYNESGNFVTSPAVKKYYAVCFSEDEQWYRAVVTSVSGVKVHVRFIDYGNSEVTVASLMRMLLPRHLDIPAFAIRCGLNLNITDNEEAKVKFEKLNEESSVKIIPQEVTGSKYIVSLSIGSISNVSEFLINNNVATMSASSVLSNGETQRPSYLRHGIDVDVCEVTILYVDTVHQFYVTPVTLDESLRKMSNNLQAIYGETEQYGLKNIALNKRYVARFNKDDLWYRAEVLSMDGNTVTVRFVDYGNVDVVTIDRMKHLLPEFSSIKAFAVPCRLNASCSDEDEMAESLSEFEGKLTLHVVNRDENFYAVDLYAAGENFVEKYDGKRPRTEATQNSEESIDHKQFGVVNNNAIPSQSEAIVDSFISGTPNDDIQSSVYQRHSLDVDECEIIILHVDSIGLFYVTPLALEETLQCMTDNIQIAHDEVGPTTVKDIQPDIRYVARYTADDFWYRAEILNANEDLITVRFVDYGNTDVVTIERLKHLLPEFTSAKAFAIPCKLDANIPASDKFNDTLNELDSEQLTVRVVESKDDVYVVDLFVDGESLSAKFEGGESASKCEEPSSQIDLKSTDNEEKRYCSIEVLPGQRCEASVSHVVNPSEFYVQLAKHNEKLIVLMDKIEERYSDCGDNLILMDFTPGNCCVAKYTEDDGWYRAAIDRLIDGDQVVIKFVDYGNAETVSCEEVKQITKDFMILPMQAIRCTLDGLGDGNPYEWTDQQTDRFHDKVCNGNAVFVDFIKVSDGKWTVQLLDEVMKVVDGLAEFTNVAAASLSGQNRNSSPGIDVPSQEESRITNSSVQHDESIVRCRISPEDKIVAGCVSFVGEYEESDDESNVRCRISPEDKIVAGCVSFVGEYEESDDESRQNHISAESESRVSNFESDTSRSKVGVSSEEKMPSVQQMQINAMKEIVRAEMIEADKRTPHKHDDKIVPGQLSLHPSTLSICDNNEDTVDTTEVQSHKHDDRIVPGQLSLHPSTFSICDNNEDAVDTTEIPLSENESVEIVKPNAGENMESESLSLLDGRSSDNNADDVQSNEQNSNSNTEPITAQIVTQTSDLSTDQALKVDCESQNANLDSESRDGTKVDDEVTLGQNAEQAPAADRESQKTNFATEGASISDEMDAAKVDAEQASSADHESHNANLEAEASSIHDEMEATEVDEELTTERVSTADHEYHNAYLETDVTLVSEETDAAKVNDGPTLELHTEQADYESHANLDAERASIGDEMEMAKVDDKLPLEQAPTLDDKPIFEQCSEQAATLDDEQIFEQCSEQATTTDYESCNTSLEDERDLVDDTMEAAKVDDEITSEPNAATADFESHDANLEGEGALTSGEATEVDDKLTLDSRDGSSTGGMLKDYVDSVTDSEQSSLKAVDQLACSDSDKGTSSPNDDPDNVTERHTETENSPDEDGEKSRDLSAETEQRS